MSAAFLLYFVLFDHQIGKINMVYNGYDCTYNQLTLLDFQVSNLVMTLCIFHYNLFLSAHYNY